MGDAYVCNNIDDVKFLFEKFTELNSVYVGYDVFIYDFKDYGGMIIFYEDGGKWTWYEKYDTDEVYNYIQVKTLSRKEKLNRILND
jgi:hypothetical protein